MPKGYIVNNVTVKDEAGYANYRVTAAKTLEDAGGTFLVRGGRHEVIEGQSYERIIICAGFSGSGSARRSRSRFRPRRHVASFLPPLTRVSRPPAAEPPPPRDE